MAAAQPIDTVEKLMTEATDDDFRWIGRKAAQQPEAAKHINFKMKQIIPRLKSKNAFWQAKDKEVVNRNTALQAALDDANATIAVLRSRIELLETEIGVELDNTEDLIEA